MCESSFYVSIRHCCAEREHVFLTSLASSHNSPLIKNLLTAAETRSTSFVRDYFKANSFCICWAARRKHFFLRLHLSHSHLSSSIYQASLDVCCLTDNRQWMRMFPVDDFESVAPWIWMNLYVTLFLKAAPTAADCLLYLPKPRSFRAHKPNAIIASLAGKSGANFIVDELVCL